MTDETKTTAATLIGPAPEIAVFENTFVAGPDLMGARPRPDYQTLNTIGVLVRAEVDRLAALYADGGVQAAQDCWYSDIGQAAWDAVTNVQQRENLYYEARDGSREASMVTRGLIRTTTFESDG